MKEITEKLMRRTVPKTEVFLLLIIRTYSLHVLHEWKARECEEERRATVCEISYLMPALIGSYMMNVRLFSIQPGLSTDLSGTQGP
jgi:hypothetical protein